MEHSAEGLQLLPRVIDRPSGFVSWRGEDYGPQMDIWRMLNSFAVSTGAIVIRAQLRGGKYQTAYSPRP